ncbi:tetratricopeptide repeat protein [Neisseria zalophi]|uniref:Sel1 repeat family protein n=1 Tax=Neisseria zalophi TaxID=640030 RepID=A0A5J6PRP9_9NEIS|nr:tetratricopeptide repeat protein [Neisseria zalophi]QEY25299.1 sel1 repeat family protein [Neisseria zalophi]
MTRKIIIIISIILIAFGYLLSYGNKKQENYKRIAGKDILVIESTRLGRDNLGNYFVVSKWDESSFRDLKSKAEKGDIPSQQMLGYLYLSGDFPNRDLIKAKYWLQKAADKNNSVAQAQLAYLYQQQGNFNDAEIWYRKSSDNGNFEARNNLVLLLMDQEVNNHKRINKLEIVSLLESLVKGEYKPAFYTLAWVYLEDDEMKNEQRGLELLTKAVEYEDVDAEYMLAQLYEEGVLVQKDLDKSKQLYARAAAKQMPEAINKLNQWRYNSNKP